MTDDAPTNLAAEQPYVTAFDATVRSVDGREVTLDRTYFYAEGGGQPADRGTLGGVEVVDVRTEDGVTVHKLAEEPAVEPGDAVAGEVDESFRTYCMRAHTASHVVYGAGRRLLGEHGYGGFDIGEDRVRLDLDTGGEGVDLDATTVQRLANEAVWDDRDVSWHEADADEARADDEIVFNLGDDVDPETVETVRIVEIEGWDRSACGGTHVATTGEVGFVKVLSVSNPGADLVRVEYTVGPAAIDRQAEETRAATRAAETLDTSVTGLPERARDLRERVAELDDEVATLRERLLSARIESLAGDTVTRDGAEWLVGTVREAGPNAVADRVADLDVAADVVALAGRDGSTFVVVGADEDAGVDAGDVVGTVTDEFGGGGGGRPTVAQGGGLDADPATVADYLREG